MMTPAMQGFTDALTVRALRLGTRCWRDSDFGWRAQSSVLIPDSGFKRLVAETAISPLGSGLSTEIYVKTMRHYCNLLHSNVTRWRKNDVLEQHQQALEMMPDITTRVVEAIRRGEL